MFLPKKKIIIILLLLVTVLAFSSNFLYPAQAQSTSTETPTPTPSSAPDNSQAIRDLNGKISELQNKITELQGQERTLSSQISVMDSQMKITEYKIENTKQEILSLEQDIDTTKKKVESLESSLENLTKVLINRIVANYAVSKEDELQILLTSNNVDQFFKKVNYLQMVEEHDQKVLYATVQAKNDYANQKDIFEEKKKKIVALQKELEAYTDELEGEKKQKQSLLAETQGSEANYQRLLKQAKAQLASFSNFARSQGGASILPPQGSPDGWYYNQRDSRWGNSNIGDSSDQVWEVGCLLTATAMLRKQRGEDITPVDVANNSSYFFSNTAMMLIPWNGGKFSSAGKNMGAIDSKLASGQPVIVGLNVNTNSVGTHFIVLKSGSAGNYIMNDPWHGANLDFSSHYNTSQIFQYGYLN